MAEGKGNSSLYLVTFLATLFLLLLVSCAIVLRSYILRRRYQRQIENALALGIVLTPRAPGSKRKRFGVRPHMYESWIAPLHVSGLSGTRVAIGEEVDETSEKRAGGRWCDMLPLTVQTVVVKRRTRDTTAALSPNTAAAPQSPEDVQLLTPLAAQDGNDQVVRFASSPLVQEAPALPTPSPPPSRLGAFLSKFASHTRPQLPSTAPAAPSSSSSPAAAAVTASPTLSSPHDSPDPNTIIQPSAPASQTDIDPPLTTTRERHPSTRSRRDSTRSSLSHWRTIVQPSPNLPALPAPPMPVENTHAPPPSSSLSFSSAPAPIPSQGPHSPELHLQGLQGPPYSTHPSTPGEPANGAAAAAACGVAGTQGQGQGRTGRPTLPPLSTLTTWLSSTNARGRRESGMQPASALTEEMMLITPTVGQAEPTSAVSPVNAAAAAAAGGAAGQTGQPGGPGTAAGTGTGVRPRIRTEMLQISVLVAMPDVRVSTLYGDAVGVAKRLRAAESVRLELAAAAAAAQSREEGLSQGGVGDAADSAKSTTATATTNLGEKGTGVDKGASKPHRGATTTTTTTEKGEMYSDEGGDDEVEVQEPEDDEEDENEDDDDEGESDETQGLPELVLGVTRLSYRHTALSSSSFSPGPGSPLSPPPSSSIARRYSHPSFVFPTTPPPPPPTLPALPVVTPGPAPASGVVQA